MKFFIIVLFFVGTINAKANDIETFLKDLTSTVWVGTVSFSDHMKPYGVSFKFNTDGTYTSNSDNGEHAALYWDCNGAHPNKTFYVSPVINPYFQGYFVARWCVGTTNPMFFTDMKISKNDSGLKTLTFSLYYAYRNGENIYGPLAYSLIENH